MKMYFWLEYKYWILRGWLFIFWWLCCFGRIQTKLKHGFFETSSNIFLGVGRKKNMLLSVYSSDWEIGSYVCRASYVWTAQIMGNLHARLSFLEIHFRFPHLSVLPIKYTEVFKQQKSHRWVFAFSQGKCNPCCLFQPVLCEHCWDLIPFHIMEGLWAGPAL